MSYKQAVEYANKIDVKLIPYEMAQGMKHTKDVISRIKEGESVGIIIGPEGGISESEISLAREKGFEEITLGRRILRTETAGMTVLSILMYHLERD